VLPDRTKKQEKTMKRKLVLAAVSVLALALTIGCDSESRLKLQELPAGLTGTWDTFDEKGGIEVLVGQLKIDARNGTWSWYEPTTDETTGEPIWGEKENGKAKYCTRYTLDILSQENLQVKMEIVGKDAKLRTIGAAAQAYFDANKDNFGDPSFPVEGTTVKQLADPEKGWFADNFKELEREFVLNGDKLEIDGQKFKRAE
jgi:hypothetical protein